MADILNLLSSQVGDNTEESNIKVVAQCLKNHELIPEVVDGLSDKDNRLVGDCAEVLTKIAETNPELIAPFAEKLIPLLESKYTRARWEAMHALAFVADKVPETISSILSQLHRMSLSDQSTIVRDYAAIAVSNYASTSKKAAEDSLPILKRILEVWKEKQASRALKGLQNVAQADPSKTSEVLTLVKEFENSPKGTVKKVAKDVLKAIEK
jgi:HEAT repeat protein